MKKEEKINKMIMKTIMNSYNKMNQILINLSIYKVDADLHVKKLSVDYQELNLAKNLGYLSLRI